MITQQGFKVIDDEIFITFFNCPFCSMTHVDVPMTPSPKDNEWGYTCPTTAGVQYVELVKNAIDVIKKSRPNE